MALKIQRDTGEGKFVVPEKCPECGQTAEDWPIFDYPNHWAICCPNCYTNVYYPNGTHLTFIIGE